MPAPTRPLENGKIKPGFEAFYWTPVSELGVGSKVSLNSEENVKGEVEERIPGFMMKIRLINGQEEEIFVRADQKILAENWDYYFEDQERKNAR